MKTRKAGSREIVISRNTLSEVRRYTNPPPHLHKVVQALLLMLGDDETKTKVIYDFSSKSECIIY